MSDPIWAPPDAIASDEPRRWLAIVATLGAFVALSVLCSVLAYSFVLRAYYIPSGSMEPTLRVGTFVLDNRLAYTTHDPGRDDIVILDQPSLRFIPAGTPGANPPRKFVKRVVAVGGDVISCCDDQNRIMVNGRAVSETFTTDQNLPIRAQRVPAHSVFVLGDHRDQSVDSRLYGAVPVAAVDGRVIGPRGTLARLAPWAAGVYAALLLTVLGWVGLLLFRAHRTAA